MERALASIGVEVRRRPSDPAPQVGVSGEPSGLRLLGFQVRNMALEVSAGAGTPPSDLDAATEAGGGGAVTPLVVGWLSSAGTPAAALARTAMGDQDLSEPNALVFPTFVLAAFLADATRRGAPAAVAADVPLAFLAAERSTDLCSQVSDYLDQTLQDVLDPTAEFDVPWLEAVIDQYAPMYRGNLELFRTTIGALALLAYATSVARPWTVLAIPDPEQVSYSVEGEEPVEGEVRVTVDAGGETFADDVRPCAALAGIELESAPTDGADLFWDPSGLAPHAQATEADSALDGDSGSLSYETAMESREDAENGDPQTAEMSVLVGVDRKEMRDLAAAVGAILLGPAQGGPAGGAVVSLYQKMKPALAEMMFPAAVASIGVTFHTQPSPSPTVTEPSIEGTWVGTWENDPSFGDPPANGGFTLTLEQRGRNVTGTGEVTGQTCVGHVTIEGSVRGSTVELSLSGERNVSSFSATWEGDSMSGTWSSIACGTADIQVFGTWQAARA